MAGGSTGLPPGDLARLLAAERRRCRDLQLENDRLNKQLQIYKNALQAKSDELESKTHWHGSCIKFASFL